MGPASSDTAGFTVCLPAAAMITINYKKQDLQAMASKSRGTSLPAGQRRFEVSRFSKRSSRIRKATGSAHSECRVSRVVYRQMANRVATEKIERGNDGRRLGRPEQPWQLGRRLLVPTAGGNTAQPGRRRVLRRAFGQSATFLGPVS